MTFWQENFSFIKDVYDTRTTKLIELMDKTDKVISKILADKIYTSNDFKKLKEEFVGLARSLEQPETKDWLTQTKDTLMTDRQGTEQDEENKKLLALLQRFDDTMPKINDTKKVVDCLWKAYQFTDELATYMDWMEDMRTKSTKDIQANSAAETEELLEKQEKFLDQIEKKKRSVLDQTAKGEKILADPKSPKFLEGHVQKLKDLWVETNKACDERLNLLKDNVQNWEKYEKSRDSLAEKLNGADAEFKATKKVFDLSECFNDHVRRTETARNMRNDIEGICKDMTDAHEVLSKIMGIAKKAEKDEEIEKLKSRMKVLESMDENLKFLEDFNAKLKEFDVTLAGMEEWNKQGRERMDDLLKPGTSLLPEERVMYTMELQSDIQVEIEKQAEHDKLWQTTLQPVNDKEKSSFAEEYVARLKAVAEFQKKLMAEVVEEGEKFGEDIKHLADFTSGCKKFEPWIVMSEAKKAKGMAKPKNLTEASELLADAKKWKEESDNMHQILTSANESAQKMTVHDDPDAKHAAYAKRWTVVDNASKDWIKKLESMVEVWQKQAETAQKVTAAIAANPEQGGAGTEMSLEDLEKNLENLKKMFIEKQKMMEQMNKDGEGEGEGAGEKKEQPAA